MSCPTAITVLEQSIDAVLTQTQTVAQFNSSFQGVAVAVAIGKNSEAVANQEAEQCNKSLQIGNATANNAVANLCGKCTDKSKAPDAALNQERSETKENTYVQIGSVAISIDGGRACAEQSLRQSNSNAQIAALQAKNSNCANKGISAKDEGKSAKDHEPDRKAHESNETEVHKTKAEATPKGREKAIVVIDMGRYQIELIVDSDGDVWINKRKIRSCNRC